MDLPSTPKSPSLNPVTIRSPKSARISARFLAMSSGEMLLRSRRLNVLRWNSTSSWVVGSRWRSSTSCPVAESKMILRNTSCLLRSSIKPPWIGLGKEQLDLVIAGVRREDEGRGIDQQAFAIRVLYAVQHDLRTRDDTLVPRRRTERDGDGRPG